jgi:hypothetical protein
MGEPNLQRDSAPAGLSAILGRQSSAPIASYVIDLHELIGCAHMSLSVDAVDAVKFSPSIF